jgi:hypothetical protein
MASYDVASIVHLTLMSVMASYDLTSVVDLALIHGARVGAHRTHAWRRRSGGRCW